MASEDEGLQWSCTVCKKGETVQRYSGGSLTCSRAAPAEEHTLSDGRKRRRRRDVREQGVALALGKHARQVEPGPSAAAGYAALIASKRCVRIRKVHLLNYELHNEGLSHSAMRP